MEFFVPVGNNSSCSSSQDDHQHHPTSSSRPTHQYQDDDSPPAAKHCTADDKLAWLKQNLGMHMLDGASGSLTSAELEAALAAMPHTLLPLLYTLTTQVRAFQEQNTELMFDLKKHRAEAERLMQERASLYDKVDAAQQDRQAAESMLASMRAETAALEKRWNEEKNELNGRLARSTWKDLTIRAQLKKKDVEYEKLQKQLTRSIGLSSGSKSTTGTMRGTVNRVRSIDITPKSLAYSGSSSSSSSALMGDEASRAALASSDHRQTLLLEENAELRETLRCLYAEIQGLQDQYGDLVEEVESSRVRQHEELAKARGAAGTSSPSPPLGEEERSIFSPQPASRRFEEGAFEMPPEWLRRVVGEELRADMAELGRRYDRLREVVKGQQQQQQQQQEEVEEEESIASALRDLTAEKKALQREVRRIKTRLYETEEVVAMQEVVIKGALFGEDAGHGRRGSQGGEGRRQRLSADSWMAENEHVESRDVQREDMEQQQQRVEEEEGGTLEEIAEKLTADLMEYGIEDKQQDIAVAAATATSAALDFTPIKKMGAHGDEQWKVTRTPLRSLSGGGGNLLSPMLQARLVGLDHDMCKHNRNNSSSSSKGESLDDGTPRGRSSLQAALGLLSPIEHHHHLGGDCRHSAKKTL
eukprot:evm.model.NODE_95_length_15206_cov_22.810799.4